LDSGCSVRRVQEVAVALTEAVLECRFAAAQSELHPPFGICYRLRPIDNPVARRYLGIVHERIGKMLEVEGRKSEALVSYEKSFALREALSSDFPANTNARRELAIAHEKIGDLLLAAGQASSGLRRLQQALEIFESLYTLDPSNANAARAVGIEYEKVAGAFALAGNPARAGLFTGKARSVFQRLASTDPMNARARADLKRVSNRH